MRACCKGVCQVGSERNVVTQVAECQRSCYSTVASLPQVSVTAALFALEVPNNVLNAAVGVLAELQTHAKVIQSEGPLYVLLEEAIVAIRSSLLVLGVCRSHIMRVVGALALIPSQPGSIRPVGTSILSTNPWMSQRLMGDASNRGSVRLDWILEVILEIGLEIRLEIIL